MTPEQKHAIAALSVAISNATRVDALNALQAHCESPDSINDVCDAVDFVLKGWDQKEQHIALVEAVAK